jgi:hypothetical protein
MKPGEVKFGAPGQDDPHYKRRVRFSLVIILSQMLLIALSLAWGIYLIVISQNGGTIISTETNKLILYGEIITTGLITIFAMIVIIMELKRLSAKRCGDRSFTSDQRPQQEKEVPKLDKDNR